MNNSPDFFIGHNPFFADVNAAIRYLRGMCPDTITSVARPGVVEAISDDGGIESAVILTECPWKPPLHQEEVEYCPHCDSLACICGID